MSTVTTAVSPSNLRGSILETSSVIRQVQNTIDIVLITDRKDFDNGYYYYDFLYESPNDFSSYVIGLLDKGNDILLRKEASELPVLVSSSPDKILVTIDVEKNLRFTSTFGFYKLIAGLLLNGRTVRIDFGGKRFNDIFDVEFAIESIKSGSREDKIRNEYADIMLQSQGTNSFYYGDVKKGFNFKNLVKRDLKFEIVGRWFRYPSVIIKI